ncbi:MAG: small ribosomal subunit Rsm22 family protein [Jatrophihabitans sp.]
MISPPAALAAELAALAGEVGSARLTAAVDRLGSAYRADGVPGGALRDVDAAAYGVYRMPATYAALRAALGQLAAADPSFAPRSVVDLGAGTGAALWAVADLWPSISSLHAVEQDPAMTEVGRRLAAAGALPDVDWQAGSVVAAALPAADLVIAGYALGELDAPDRDGVLAAVAADTVVVVEPGTPRGFTNVLAARGALIESGRSVAAPCPHSDACPMAGSDWCHFAVRLPRSAAQRRAKGGELGYEDEKFSFVAASRRPVTPAAGRILRHPQRRTGHVGLRLCGADRATSDVIVSKRNKELYRSARKADWGDEWPPRP